MRTNEDGTVVLSLYKDEQLTMGVFNTNYNLLKKNFDNLDEEMRIIFLDTLKANGYTNQRLKDAVKYVVESHKYNTIRPAHILEFDKILNLRTYFEIAKEQKEFGNTVWNYFEKVDIKGICYYVNKAQLRKYNITLPEYKPRTTTGGIRNKRYPASESLSKDFSFKDEFDKLIQVDEAKR